MSTLIPNGITEWDEVMIETLTFGDSQLDEDKRTFAGYVAASMEKLASHILDGSWRQDQVQGDIEIWNERANSGRIDTSYGALFRGPWHVTRKYVTTEVRQFFEEFDNPRMTFTEWRAECIASRERERTRELDYLDSSGYCLDELAKLRELQDRRDELILTARERGAGWRAIGESIGISRAQLHNIATRHADRLANAAPNSWDEDEPF
jgi:hypothetical protein